MSRTSALGQFTNLPVLADAADITAVGTTMADRIEKYVIMRYASTGARDAAITSPEEGMCAYVGSNDSAEGPVFYNSTAWRQPWNMPWGTIGTTTTTADQNGITAATDLTSLSIAFTAVANRIYRAMGTVYCLQNTATSNVDLQIRNGAGTAQARDFHTGVVVGNVSLSCTMRPLNFGAGAQTLKLNLSTSAGTIDVKGASFVGWFMVEDIGPAGAPT